MLHSPFLGEPFYLARDSHAFDAVKKQDLAVYMESELPRLKGLDKEMLYWLHQGKKFGGKILKEERRNNDQRR